MVQRYTPYASGYGEGYLCESAGGDWVSYEDYAKLELKVLATLSHLERASDASNLGLQAGYMAMALRVLRNDN